MTVPCVRQRAAGDPANAFIAAGTGDPCTDHSSLEPFDALTVRGVAQAAGVERADCLSIFLRTEPSYATR